MGRKRKSPLIRDCLRCGDPLPPSTGPGRPRLYHARCTPTTAPLPPEPVAVNLGAGLELDELGLERRGRVLWDELSSDMPTPAHRELLLEACRLADRGERMHALLRGERGAWVVLKLPDFLARSGLGATDDEIEISVNISSVAIEARNTATALKAIVAELRQAMKRGAQEDGPDALDGLMDEVAAARNRRADAS